MATTCSERGFFLRTSPSVFPTPGSPNRYPEHMPNVGPWEIILLLLLALLLFGAKRLPEIGRSMGRGMREFKDSVSGKDHDDEPAELPMQTTDATVAARERERDPA
jgi:sec-independent protein translocase protein TatA